MKPQGTPNSKNNLKKNNKVGRLTLLDFKNFAKLQQSMCYWHKDRYADQWTIIQRPEVNQYLCGQLIVDCGAKTTQQENDIVFSNR